MQTAVWIFCIKLTGKIYVTNYLLNMVLSGAAHGTVVRITNTLKKRKIIEFVVDLQYNGACDKAIAYQSVL